MSSRQGFPPRMERPSSAPCMGRFISFPKGDHRTIHPVKRHLLRTAAVSCGTRTLSSSRRILARRCADPAEKLAPFRVDDLTLALIQPEPDDDHLPLRNDEAAVVVVSGGGEHAGRRAEPHTPAVGLDSVHPPVEAVAAASVDPAF